jgi:hypothetical protein
VESPQPSRWRAVKWCGRLTRTQVTTADRSGGKSATEQVTCRQVVWTVQKRAMQTLRKCRRACGRRSTSARCLLMSRNLLPLGCHSPSCSAFAQCEYIFGVAVTRHASPRRLRCRRRGERVSRQPHRIYLHIVRQASRHGSCHPRSAGCAPCRHRADVERLPHARLHFRSFAEWRGRIVVV